MLTWSKSVRQDRTTPVQESRGIKIKMSGLLQVQAQTQGNVANVYRYAQSLASSQSIVIGHEIDGGRGRGDLHPPHQYLQHTGLEDTLNSVPWVPHSQ